MAKARAIEMGAARDWAHDFVGEQFIETGLAPTAAAIQRFWLGCWHVCHRLFLCRLRRTHPLSAGEKLLENPAVSYSLRPAAARISEW